jgi:uncharacterized protein
MTANPSVAYCGVAVMAKASLPGKAKTRLCPPLSAAEAADFNTAFLKDIAENLAAAGARASIAGTMAYSPAGSEAFFKANIPSSIRLREMSAPRFGDCLTGALMDQFAAGHEAACVLNSDSPTLPAQLLVEMADVLREPGDRAVLGPSLDGGYYLLALKTMHYGLFEDIAWSTAAVAAQTLDRAAGIGLPVHLLPEWYDVDDCEGIRLLIGELLEGRPFAPSLTSSPAPYSLALLKTLIERTDLMNRLAASAGRDGRAPQGAVA